MQSHILRASPTTQGSPWTLFLLLIGCLSDNRHPSQANTTIDGNFEDCSPRIISRVGDIGRPTRAGETPADPGVGSHGCQGFPPLARYARPLLLRLPVLLALERLPNVSLRDILQCMRRIRCPLKLHFRRAAKRPLKSVGSQTK